MWGLIEWVILGLFGMLLFKYTSRYWVQKVPAVDTWDCVLCALFSPIILAMSLINIVGIAVHQFWLIFNKQTRP